MRVTESIMQQMREKFGDEQTDEYIRLGKAMRSLIALWDAFVKAPSDSNAEVVTQAVLDRMLSQLLDRREHSIGMIEGLLSLILHMREGGDYDEWFRAMGIAPYPGGKE
jgi:hypothetical protein